MKIKHLLAGILLLISASASLQSCGLFNGGNNCDCPKFGQVNDPYQMIYFAQEAAEAGQQAF